MMKKPMHLVILNDWRTNDYVLIDRHSGENMVSIFICGDGVMEFSSNTDSCIIGSIIDILDEVEMVLDLAVLIFEEKFKLILF